MSSAVNEYAKVIESSARSERDTGSPEVQVSLLTHRIKQLTEHHFSHHKKDNHSRRGLLKMINMRKKLLNYLWKKDQSRYYDLIKTLGLRDKKRI
ncbi:MAG: 30S ribosomal protein S15 [Legionellales bacterium]|nr:30S ribosomal protein S15 [Legionellales bacterium]